ncbi:hypothetical protein ACLI1A_13435 [Flavobacterium sp. RHBU_3]|uniref:hypothetical protein n=1 Tax=Flavobacterium sp. RHBU_3 TaxID=3391184 RepID=UPI003984C6F6
MIIINSYSNKRFTLNGVQYLKNYVSRVSGNRVQIYNCYDNADVLAGFDIYGNYIVNGETFSNAALLQEALLDVIFSRGTLGNDVGELIQDNKRLVKDVTIATTDTETQILAKINALPLYLVDEQSLVSYKCYDEGERVLVYNTIGVGKGSYGLGGTQLTLDNLLKVYEYVPYVNQNNIHNIITYTANGTGNTPLSTLAVANLINSNFPISVQETTVPWIAVNIVGTIPVIKHVYWFKGGKGLWGGPSGSGGTEVNKGMLQFLLTQNAAPEDVQDGGNTSVIPLGTVTNGDYITAANTTEHDLSNPDLYYFLKFNYDGVDYLLQFIGSEYGLYGGSNALQFTQSDFEEIPVVQAPEPYIPNLQQVTTQGGSTDKPITTSDGISATEIQPTGGLMLKGDGYKITLMLDPEIVYESFNLLIPQSHLDAGYESLLFQSSVISTPGRPVIRSKVSGYNSIGELEVGDEISHRIGNLIIHSAIYNGGDPDYIENLSILLSTEI